MHSAHLNDFNHMRELEAHAPSAGANQKKSPLRPAQFSPMRVSSLVMRPAMSRIDRT
jgi:hypothetical protein